MTSSDRRPRLPDAQLAADRRRDDDHGDSRLRGATHDQIERARVALEDLMQTNLSSPEFQLEQRDGSTWRGP